MADEEKIVELGRHDPDVASVMSRLDRYHVEGRIKALTAIVQWDDGSYDVVCDTKNIGNLAYEGLVLQRFLIDLVGIKGGGR